MKIEFEIIPTRIKFKKARGTAKKEFPEIDIIFPECRFQKIKITKSHPEFDKIMEFIRNTNGKTLE